MSRLHPSTLTCTVTPGQRKLLFMSQGGDKLAAAATAPPALTALTTIVPVVMTVTADVHHEGIKETTHGQ